MVINKRIIGLSLSLSLSLSLFLSLSIHVFPEYSIIYWFIEEFWLFFRVNELSNG